MAEYVNLDMPLDLMVDRGGRRITTLRELLDINKIYYRIADVAEVVRCKDCKFFEPDTYSDAWCSAKTSGVSKGMMAPSGDSYCSDAVKRGGDDV